MTEKQRKRKENLFNYDMFIEEQKWLLGIKKKFGLRSMAYALKKVRLLFKKLKIDSEFE